MDSMEMFDKHSGIKNSAAQIEKLDFPPGPQYSKEKLQLRRNSGMHCWARTVKDLKKQIPFLKRTLKFMSSQW